MSSPGSDADDFDQRLHEMHREQIRTWYVSADVVEKYLSALDKYSGMRHDEHPSVTAAYIALGEAEDALRAALARTK